MRYKATSTIVWIWYSGKKYFWDQNFYLKHRGVLFDVIRDMLRHLVEWLLWQRIVNCKNYVHSNYMFNSKSNRYWIMQNDRSYQFVQRYIFFFGPKFLFETLRGLVWCYTWHVATCQWTTFYFTDHRKMRKFIKIDNIGIISHMSVQIDLFKIISRFDLVKWQKLLLAPKFFTRI